MGKRIAAYLLTDYLERMGVEVVFGLCGHTVIAMLDALGMSRSPPTPPTDMRARPANRASCCCTSARG